MERISLWTAGLYLRLQTAMEREEGQTMAEYGLLIAFIALVALIGATLLGTSLKGFFTSLANQI